MVSIRIKKSKEEKAAKEERWRQESERNKVFGEPFNPVVQVNRGPTQTGNVDVNVMQGHPPMVQIHVQRSDEPTPAPQLQPGWGQSMPTAPQMPGVGEPAVQVHVQRTDAPPPGQPVSKVPPGVLGAGTSQVGQFSITVERTEDAPAPVPTPSGVPSAVATQSAAQEEVDLSLVLSAHLRPHMTERQLVSIMRQSVRPKNITVVVSPGLPVHEQVLSNYQQVRTTFPLTSWWRFQFASTLRTKYVAILDDDTLPAAGWLKEAVAYLEDHPNDCVCSAGLVLDKELGEEPVGPENAPKDTRFVDIGTGGWVLRTCRLQEALINGGDIPGDVYGWGVIISYGLQPAKGHCVVLPYTDNRAGMSVPPLLDQYSLRRSPHWNEEHHAIVRDYRSVEWKLLCDPVNDDP
jgi:hypothetical protein